MIFKRRTTQAEFEQEVMPHLQSLYGVAVRMTRCDSDAEDLVQDTILRAYRFWDGFQRGTNARAWLMRIMTNLFRNRYRERAREQEVLGEAETSTANVGQFQGAAPRDAESALFGRMLSRDVEKALARSRRSSGCRLFWLTSRISPTRRLPTSWSVPRARS